MTTCEFDLTLNIKTGHFGIGPCGHTCILVRSGRCGSTPIMTEEGPSAEIATGPFAEFIARIPHDEDNQRFWLVLDFLGQKMRVQVTHD